MAEALYRKYRPQVFSEVVGQDHIERTLKNAIDQDKLSHAYLFCGPRGTGKTTTARLLAKALLCVQGPTSNPDGTCDSCEEIARGEHPDVYELDAASRTGVENVREEIIGRVQFAPTRGRSKVYIIDEVHMLSTAAFNALLKTLEEPPSHVVFILCTTDPQKVPETILSRCQRFDFRRIANEGMTARLEQICQAEGVSYEKEALELISRRSDGGLRNALTALEQAIAFGDGVVSRAMVDQLGGTQAAYDLTALVDALAHRDTSAAFLWLDSFAQTGGDFAFLASGLAQRVRDLYLVALAGTQAPLSARGEIRDQIISQAASFAPDRLAYLLEVLGDTTVQLKTASNARLCFEIALTKICRPESDLTLASLAARIEALEKGSGVALRAAAPASVVAEPAAFAESAAAEASSGEAFVEKAALVVEAEASDAVEAAPAFASEKAHSSAAALAPASEAILADTASASAPSVESAAVARPSAPSSSKQSFEGFSNPASVQRMWQRAFAEIKRDRPAYTTLLMSARASFDASTESLLISFRPSYGFALSVLQKPDALDYLHQVVSRVAGVDMPVVVAVVDEAGAVLADRSVSSREGAVPADSLAASREVEAKRTASDQASALASVSTGPVDALSSATPGWSPDGRGPATQLPDDGDPSYRYEEVPLDTYDDVGFYEGEDEGAFDEFSPEFSTASALVPESELPPASGSASASRLVPSSAVEPASELTSASVFTAATASTQAPGPALAASSASVAASEPTPAAAQASTPAASPALASASASNPATAPEPATTPPASERAPWDDDPFALPEDDGPVMELDEFQEMLFSSFGDGVVVEEV